MTTSNRTYSKFGRANRFGSHFALAIALVAGTALSVGAFAEPAFAKKREESKAPKADYSKGFIAVYTPTNDWVNAGVVDATSGGAKVAALMAAVETDDDRNAAGGLIYNLGGKLDDQDMQLDGLGMMLESGKNDQTRVGQFQFTAYQLQLGKNNYDEARVALQGAIDAGYSFQGTLSDGTSKKFESSDLQVMLSEVYFDEEDYSGGLSYLQGLVDRTVTAGGKPEQNWLRRGFSVAFQNDLFDWATKFGAMEAQYYPTAASWGNVLAVQRVNFDSDENVTLDIMRLADRVGALQNGRDYADYMNAADARRLPGEVKRVVEEGLRVGQLEKSDPFVQEAKTTADERIAGDKAEIPALEADARKANSTGLTATAAGDVFLSYGMASKAEEMYAIAATKPDADIGRVLTRLGIAQTDQGKIDAAKATFARIQGARAPVAKLWTIYAASKAPASEPT
ncbi:MAG: hypothetical protein WAT93_04215, partial [Pontixanthobacter sp.]